MIQAVMNKEQKEAQIIEAIKTVHDPEIPVNIYELGLIYKVELKDNGAVYIEMTLTSPACPVAERGSAVCFGYDVSGGSLEGLGFRKFKGVINTNCR